MVCLSKKLNITSRFGLSTKEWTRKDGKDILIHRNRLAFYVYLSIKCIAGKNNKCDG